MKTIHSFGEACMRMAHDRRKYETAKTCRTVLRHLERFTGNQNLRFSNLTPGFLMDLRRYLLDKGCCNNTCLLYFHYLQALHRRAARQGEAPDPDDLYDVVITDSDETVKRCISGLQLKQIRDAVLPQQYAYLGFARDLFILSFYLRGIPFVDLAHLRQADIKDGVLRYHRRKTDKPLVVTLEPCALRIINRWRNRPGDSPYLFPIIKKPGSDNDERRQYESALRLYNKYLKAVAKAVGLGEGVRLTSYVQRHTWASLAHEDGVELPLISEALSHSSEKTTRHYVNSFTPDALAMVNRRVMGVIDRPCYKEKERRQEKPQLRSGYLIEPEYGSDAK